MNKCLLIFLGSLLTSSLVIATEDSETAVPIFGPGLYSCSSYVDEHITEDGKDVFNSWVSGFVSSLSMFHSEKFNFKQEITPLYSDIERICRLEPDIFFSEAVSKAFVGWMTPMSQK